MDAYRLEIIQWLDHCSINDNWKRNAEVKELEPAIVYSVGWVIHENDDYLTLVAHCGVDTDGNMSDEEQSTGEMCIVKSAITQRWSVAVQNCKVV